MRNYPIDSPQAKARIIALALLADGGLDKSEIECLEGSNTLTRIGITSNALDVVMHEFYQDIHQSGLFGPNGQLRFEHPSIEAMLDEIRQRDVRKALLRAIFDIVHADRNVGLGEAKLTALAMTRWGISRQSFEPEKQSHLDGLPPQVRNLVAEACS